tara:strand:- start:480 stop:623 length:144 start_codon:yes stop_codon:yes gene_type:complete
MVNNESKNESACFNCGITRYVNPNGLCNKCQMIKDRKIEKKNKGEIK